MDAASPPDVTQLLQAWSRGEESALDKLVPLVYRDLHLRARRCMAGEHVEHSLQTTALIHEAYLKLVGPSPVAWESRGHFFAVASRVMRRVLVDHARARRSLKRGGDGRHVELDEELVVAGGPDRDLVSLDDALKGLATVDERKARVVEMRYFGGLSVEETAEVLEVSPQTVLRDWRLAKAWLLREMKRGGSPTPGPEETP
ncbi:MAG: sigma-70 family RNA polymerase sigma factor [Zetaproteobacteria bacterium]|nr:MAG: sigma-70 family RNA polymerase sigma factor [Zetaproteobacteria bacterium]